MNKCIWVTFVWPMMCSTDSYKDRSEHISPIWRSQSLMVLYSFSTPSSWIIIFTTRVSGRGNRIGAVFPSVCVSALSHPNHLTYDLNFWCIPQYITKNGLLGKRTVQFGKREVRERSGVFTLQVNAAELKHCKEMICHGDYTLFQKIAIFYIILLTYCRGLTSVIVRWDSFNR